jgi:hypothetical protein
VHNVYAAMGLICFALWGYASWSTMGLTLPSDLFPQGVVATVTGLSGLAAGLVGAVFTIAVGILVDRFSYTPAFLVAGLMPLFATAFLFLLIRQPIKSSTIKTDALRFDPGGDKRLPTSHNRPGTKRRADRMLNLLDKCNRRYKSPGL